MVRYLAWVKGTNHRRRGKSGFIILFGSRAIISNDAAEPVRTTCRAVQSRSGHAGAELSQLVHVVFCADVSDFGAEILYAMSASVGRSSRYRPSSCGGAFQ